MASSRRQGTNEEIATYGTGKTYTSLSTWEGDTDIDLVTATKSCVLEIYGNSYTDGNVTLAGATTSTSYFRIIRPAAGNFLNTGAISTKHFARTSYGDVFALNESYSQIQDIVATTSFSHADSKTCFTVWGNITGAGYIGCVAIDAANSGTGLIRGFEAVPSTTAGNKLFVVNCLAHNCDGDGFLFNPANNAYAIGYNCTATNNGAYGFNGNSSTYCILKNCGATGNTTAQIEDGTFAETTDSESAPTFVNAAGDDFHLSAADSVWKDVGTDLSADVNYAFNDDIDFATRTGTWDIGFDEVTAAGGVDITGTETLKFAESLD